MGPRARRLVLFGAPAATAVVNVSHPIVMPPIYDAVLHHMPWWIVLHLANLVLFPLVGLAAWMLVWGREDRAAVIARAAIAVFIPMYAAFDSLAGIGTGVFVGQASLVTPSDPSAVGSVIDGYWQSPVLLGVATAGSVAWVVAMLSAAVSFCAVDARKRAGVVALLILIVTGVARGVLFQVPGAAAIQPAWWIVTLACGAIMAIVARPRLPIALLTLAGSLFGASHVTPTGPLGLGCLIAASILLRRTSEDSRLIRVAPRRAAA
jgi:hypothetical protein